jgi:hypothetical protein
LLNPAARCERRHHLSRTKSIHGISSPLSSDKAKISQSGPKFGPGFQVKVAQVVPLSLGGGLKRSFEAGAVGGAHRGVLMGK